MLFRSYTHVLNNLDDNFKGIDRVGSLIITKNKTCVWAGSMLSNTDRSVGLHSGTTAQVAVSVLSFMHWILDNPKNGANFPEVCDERYIYDRIKPYYGFYIDFVDYKPSSLQFEDLRRTKEEFDKQFSNKK